MRYTVVNVSLLSLVQWERHRRYTLPFYRTKLAAYRSFLQTFHFFWANTQLSGFVLLIGYFLYSKIRKYVHISINNNPHIITH